MVDLAMNWRRPNHGGTKRRNGHSVLSLALPRLRESSWRGGHANLLCTVPILTDDPRRGSCNMPQFHSTPFAGVGDTCVKTLVLPMSSSSSDPRRQSIHSSFRPNRSGTKTLKRGCVLRRGGCSLGGHSKTVLFSRGDHLFAMKAPLSR